MQNRIIKLTVTFVVLFSLQGESQTTEKSKHPLLDKYYPQIQNTDASKDVTSQIKPAPETKPAPAVTTTTVPAVTTTTAPAVTTTPVPVATTTPVPVVTTTTVPAMITEPAVTTTPAVTNTTTINKPTTVTAQAPARKAQTQPAPYPYSETWLGSSTKQYDTWEKNNNGAGSVTTSPK